MLPEEALNPVETQRMGYMCDSVARVWGAQVHTHGWTRSDAFPSCSAGRFQEEEMSPKCCTLRIDIRSPALLFFPC